MTRSELAVVLEEGGVRSDAYSLDGTLVNDAIILSEVYGDWLVFYFERGERSEEHVFETEDEACRCVAGLLLEEPSVQVEAASVESSDGRVPKA